jgi:hypothetical protein
MPKLIVSTFNWDWASILRYALCLFIFVGLLLSLPVS